jgi:CheY-like chemotaxis protein
MKVSLIAYEGGRDGFEASALRPRPFAFLSKGEIMSAAAVTTVLTVEDDPIVRADLRLVLEDAGFEVSAARDAVEAVELAREHEPDAILLDLGLPGIGGVEATRQILSERVVPIVALTGRSRGLAEEAVEAGASSYVLKPFVPEEVVGALLDAIASHADPLHKAREESLRTIATMCGLLGYAEEWAVELEESAFRAGKLWHEASGPWRQV